MRKTTLILVVCLFGILTALRAEQSLFQELSIEQGQERAASEQKLLLVHFSATWCMPSSWMEENTFSTPEIQEYLRKDYLPIKVDVDLPQGYTDKERYQIATLPTLLIFSASGKLLDRIEGITNADNLATYLQKNNLPKNRRASRAVRNRPAPLAQIGSPSFAHLDKPAFVASTAAENETYYTPVYTPSLPMPQSTPAYEAPVAESPVVALNQTEYGVEVAVLQDYGNVIRYVSNLERKFDQKVYIILEQEGTQKNYHVIVGAYPNRKDAYQLRSHLLKFQIRGAVTPLAFE